mmetsp:Transcript_34885/g.86576  ORF Transcript_34885/g.86576 Transcript_34885/m.86576 type:complete len:230 (+) Transcript_34885:8003-8692(+)
MTRRTRAPSARDSDTLPRDRRANSRTRTEPRSTKESGRRTFLLLAMCRRWTVATDTHTPGHCSTERGAVQRASCSRAARGSTRARGRTTCRTERENSSSRRVCTTATSRVASATARASSCTRMARWATVPRPSSRAPLLSRTSWASSASTMASGRTTCSTERARTLTSLERRAPTGWTTAALAPLTRELMTTAVASTPAASVHVAARSCPVTSSLTPCPTRPSIARASL